MCPEVNDGIFHHWTIITGCIDWFLHEPITGGVNFDVFIKKYVAVHIGMYILG